MQDMKVAISGHVDMRTVCQNQNGGNAARRAAMAVTHDTFSMFDRIVPDRYCVNRWLHPVVRMPSLHCQNKNSDSKTDSPKDFCEFKPARFPHG